MQEILGDIYSWTKSNRTHNTFHENPLLRQPWKILTLLEPTINPINSSTTNSDLFHFLLRSNLGPSVSSWWIYHISVYQLVPFVGTKEDYSITGVSKQNSLKFIWSTKKTTHQYLQGTKTKSQKPLPLMDFQWPYSHSLLLKWCLTFCQQFHTNKYHLPNPFIKPRLANHIITTAINHDMDELDHATKRSHHANNHKSNTYYDSQLSAHTHIHFRDKKPWANNHRPCNQKKKEGWTSQRTPD